MDIAWNAPTLRSVADNMMEAIRNGRESTSIFVASSFGPLRVNPLFTFNYTANYDGVNGWYYQIGVIKYNFLD